MIRNLKAMGLALFAVFALTALTASAAQAAEEFHSHTGVFNQEATILTGEADPISGGTQKFWTNPEREVAVECVGASFAGTVTGTTTGNGTLTTPTATVHPEYFGPEGPGSNCVAAGFAASVNTGTCHYKLQAATVTAGMANVTIEGPEHCITITIPAINCQIYINPQTVNGVNYINRNEGTTNEKEVTVESTVTHIHYTTNSGGCFLAGIAATGSEAEYAGNVTVEGREDERVTATGTYAEGAQVGIWKE